ncbi:calcium and integrin-binding family member 2 [Anabrus simplex]|uniref:calcium and integrin-binding family member 2 n=1 Tax=Anabrus simplex TaxID=316456 RepID=UPI0034DD306D
MGLGSSVDLKDEYIEDYLQLLYLNRTEILQLLKRFKAIGPDEVNRNIHHRFHASRILEAFPEFKVNPFQDRLFKVFSSHHDGCFSFEDILDLYSALSENCPTRVKAMWAFKIFDLDDDNFITEEDVMRTVERLTNSNARFITEDEKRLIANSIIGEVDLAKTGGITPLEFVHAVLKMPEFSNCFRCKP